MQATISSLRSRFAVFSNVKLVWLFNAAVDPFIFLTGRRVPHAVVQNWGNRMVTPLSPLGAALEVWKRHCMGSVFLGQKAGLSHSAYFASPGKPRLSGCLPAHGC
jgi:hypothetical protein